jgi:hypothetical protein
VSIGSKEPVAQEALDKLSWDVHGEKDFGRFSHMRVVQAEVAYEHLAV